MSEDSFFKKITNFFSKMFKSTVENEEFYYTFEQLVTSKGYMIDNC